LAANNFIDLRKANMLDFFDKEIGDLLTGLKNANYDPWIWEFSLTQQSPDAVAEARVGFTNEFNGETTPAYLFIIGAHAQDKAAGTGAQKVTLFGIDENGNPFSYEETMHATAATEKQSTHKYKRFIGAIVTGAGSGLVNAGAILITDTGQGNTYGTIATGENCTIGTRVYVPADYNAFIGGMCAACKAAPHATDELVFGDGIMIEPLYYTNPNLLNKDSYFVRVEQGMDCHIDICKRVIVGANTYYISFKHATKAQDANKTATICIKIIMYGTTNTLRGLPA
jgi:hypothetical protein